MRYQAQRFSRARIGLRAVARVAVKWAAPPAAVLLAVSTAAAQTSGGFAGAGLTVGFADAAAASQASAGLSVAFQPYTMTTAAATGISVAFQHGTTEAGGVAASISVGFSAGGGTSGASDFLAVEFSANPVPTISALRPPEVRAGRGTFRLTASGSEFVAGATLFWNGSPRPTTVADGTEVHATIDAADVAAAGTASIIVQNPVPELGPSAPATFTITNSAPSFTDDPLTARTTPIKIVHLTELRQQIDVLRVRYGLPPFGWTDPVLAPRTMPVRAVHLSELRTALAGVCAAAGEAPPAFTDPTIVTGTTAVAAAHLMELRALVARLW